MLHAVPREADGCAAEGALQHAQALLQARELEGILPAFNEAERLGARRDECAAGRWLVCMLRGEMEAAWRESDAIRARGAPDPHRFWDGSGLRARRVMVRCLHGYGDTIQMLRYVPGLLEMAASVTLEVPPRLLPLMQAVTAPGDERLTITTWEQSPGAAPPWDTQIEVTELPYVFRTQRSDLPIRTNYLQLPRAAVEQAADAMGRREPGQRVGVVWTAGEWNPERAIDPGMLRGLVSAPAEFWSLTQRPQLQKLTDDEVRRRLRDAEVAGEGILPMAAVIRNLDLVISTDTMAAHVAGALGVPVWVMLPFAADWRWMYDGDGSPWYPSMRLFRQTSPGDWAGVVRRVESALGERLEKERQ